MRFSIVIVCFGGDVARLLDEVGRQRAEGDEVIVVDNLATAGGSAGVRGNPQIDRLIDGPGNVGFASGVNLGAAVASGDTLLLLNPDTIPAPGCLDELRRPPAGYDAWMGVVTLPDHERINTAGGHSHYLGFSWVGRFGEPVAELAREPYTPGFMSGACLAVKLGVWRELGGFPDHFFLYFDDVDLSHRLRLAGRAYGVLPAARVEHEYEFHKGELKWRKLERNRWATIVRTYPAPLLALVLPALLAIELPLLAVALASGWGPAKLRSWGEVLRWLPHARGERRTVQATARISPREFAAGLTPRLESPLFGGVGRSRIVNALLAAYWRGVLGLLAR